MRDLKINNKLKTRCIILGGTATGGGAYIQSLHTLIQQYELSDFVVFTGYIGQMEANNYIAAMDFMNHPFVDGYSPKNSSMIAVISMDKPIITTKRMGKKTHDVKGIYYLDKASDKVQMKEYVCNFQDHPNLFTDVDYTGLDYSWERNGMEHMCVYDHLT